MKACSVIACIIITIDERMMKKKIGVDTSIWLKAKPFLNHF